jgi:phosphoglycerate dehydrogenase-like enzyme
MKLLLTGAYSYTNEQLNHLESLGYQITMLQDERTPSTMKFADIEAVVCNNMFRHTNIEEFKNLKFIQLISTGTDRIPVDFIEKAGIKLETARGVYSIPIAEWVVLKILEITKKSRHFFYAQQQHQWQKERNLEELTGKTAAIVGYGSIGVETAKRLQAFDVKITAVDTRKPAPDEMTWIHELQPPEELDIVLANKDIVILTLPLTRQTHHLINKQRLELMKDDAILINVSRGPIVDELALIAALKQNKFAGVALDVFEKEPLAADSPLWDFKNVLATPHNAFVSGKNHQRLFDLISKNLSSYAKQRQNEIPADIA